MAPRATKKAASSKPASNAAVVDDKGQVDPNGPQGKATLRTTALDPRQYAKAGEGYQPGESAPDDVWLDTQADKITKTKPEQGQVITKAGSPVPPWAARLLSDRGFKG
jgi:hypothetical protein